MIQETIDKGVKIKPEVMKKDKPQSPQLHCIKKHERMATLNEFYNKLEEKDEMKFSQSNKRINTENQYIKALANSKKNIKN